MKTTYIIPVLFLMFAFPGCDKPTGSSEVTEASDEKQFVWNGLNLWYFWQSSVSNLDDNRFADDQAYFEFLNGFSDEERLFASLLFAEDDFSRFIEDYAELEQLFQGISKSFGFGFGLVQISGTNNVFGYIQYIVPDSPGHEAGLVRGDVFTRINGTRLTVNNYSDLLNSESYTLTLAKIEGGSIQETGETENIRSEVLQENPIHMAEVIEAGQYKVGYLVFNSFFFNFHEDLNEVFGFFQQEQIDDLIIDLRYNGGGALITSAILASMISGFDESKIFAHLIHNEKKTDNNSIYPFFDRVPLYNEDRSFDRWIDMHQLNLDKIYLLTGRGTASASEVLINGLSPFMQVIQIGEVTRGKDEGSITVYDNPPDYNSSNGANPNHMRAMQPIINKVLNSNMEGYPNGFSPQPDDQLSEINYLENLPPLGDKNEPLLARALDIIAGTDQIARITAFKQYLGEMITDSNDLKPLGTDMYVLPGEE